MAQHVWQLFGKKGVRGREQALEINASQTEPIKEGGIAEVIQTTKMEQNH